MNAIRESLFTGLHRRQNQPPARRWNRRATHFRRLVPWLSAGLGSRLVL